MITSLEPLVVLTGAGISAESGVPTFRGEGGFWENYPVESLATPSAFHENPERVWRFYDWRREIVRQCRPNPAHKSLADMEAVLNEFTLITQNVDGLHQQAGSERIIEIHGSLWDLRCKDCSRHWVERGYLKVEDGQLPHCSNCGGLARPNVVWFGEALNPLLWRDCEAQCKRAATLLVIGTSAIVQPVANLPYLAKQHGARLIEVNIQPTPISDLTDERYEGPAAEQLPIWWERNKPL